MKKILTLVAVASLTFWGCNSNSTSSSFNGIKVATVTTGPDIDGNGNDAAWNSADSYTVTTGESTAYQNAFGPIDVTFKAVQDGEYVYFLASWADATENVDKNQWHYDNTTGTWEKEGNEDRIYFMWDTGLNGTEGADCSSMCHVPDPGKMWTTGGGWVDVWHWKAARTNPVNLADDKYFDGNHLDNGEEAEDGGRHGDAKTIGSYSNNNDNGMPEYSGPITDGHYIIIVAGADESSLTQFENNADTQALTIPGYIVNENADGSRADVTAKGVWSNGVWTVELKRKLDTGHAGDDVIFTAGNTYQASIAVADNSGGSHSGTFPVDVKF